MYCIVIKIDSSSTPSLNRFDVRSSCVRYFLTADMFETNRLMAYPVAVEF